MWSERGWGNNNTPWLLVKTTQTKYGVELKLPSITNFLSNSIVQLLQINSVGVFHWRILLFTCPKLNSELCVWNAINNVCIVYDDVQRQEQVFVYGLLLILFGADVPETYSVLPHSKQQFKIEKNQFLGAGRANTNKKIKSNRNENVSPTINRVAMSWCLGMNPTYFPNGKWLQHTYFSLFLSLCCWKYIASAHNLAKPSQVGKIYVKSVKGKKK